MIPKVEPLVLNYSFRFPAGTAPLNATTLLPAFASISDASQAIEIKLNEVVAALSAMTAPVVVNPPQFKLAAGNTVVLANVRVPEGWIGALMNAVVSGGATLTVSHVPGQYGTSGIAGNAVTSSTSSEISVAAGQELWLPAGEFVVSVTNGTNAAVIVAASALLSIKR